MRFRNNWLCWIARGLGTGLSPYAPGTVGTILGIPIVLLLDLLPAAGFITGAMLLVLVSIWSSGYASRGLDLEDDPSIVIDEIAGFVVTMTLVPLNIWTIILGFLLFRFFDIFKVPPANWFDKRWTGGLGITGDDVIAGIYANIVLQVALRI